jgi:hypothetical protein
MVVRFVYVRDIDLFFSTSRHQGSAWVGYSSLNNQSYLDSLSGARLRLRRRSSFRSLAHGGIIGPTPMDYFLQLRRGKKEEMGIRGH